MDHDQPTDPTRDEVAKLLAKVTPGPWQAISTDPAQGWDGWEVKAQPHPAMRGFSSDLAAANGPQSDPHREANAALIALAPFLAREYVSGAHGAEAMQNRLIDALASIEVAYVLNNEPIAADAAAKCLDAVLTVSSPSPAALLADARALPEIAALVETAKHSRKWITNYTALNKLDSALAALKGGAK